MTTRRRRLLTAGSAAVFVVAGLASITPTASATPAPRTYTASISPKTATTGASQIYTVTVTNTSKNLSAMDRFVLAIPAGFTVTPGVATSPRGGVWTETLSANSLTMTTNQPLKYGLRKGELLTVSFTAKDTIACDKGDRIWTQKGDGVLIDPWVAQTPAATTVTVNPVADRFVVTSVTDVDGANVGSQVLVSPNTFAISGEFRCGASLVAPAGSVGTVSLSDSGAGTVGGTLSSAVTAASTTASFSAVTYSQVENGVGLTADWSAGADGSATVDVLGAAKSVIGAAGTAIPPAALTIPGGIAGLGSGANGPVSIVASACAPLTPQDDPAALCSATGTETELTGNFKGLYSFESPASLTRVCPASTCPHPDQEGAGTNYLYNFTCAGSSCQEGNETFGEREVEEDLEAYPTYVSLSLSGGGSTPFVEAPRCVPLPASNNDPQKSYLLSVTGKILNPDAQALGFCVDVNAMSRTGNSFFGDLSIPILFVEDIKARP